MNPGQHPLRQRGPLSAVSSSGGIIKDSPHIHEQGTDVYTAELWGSLFPSTHRDPWSSPEPLLRQDRLSRPGVAERMCPLEIRCSRLTQTGLSRQSHSVSLTPLRWADAGTTCLQCQPRGGSQKLTPLTPDIGRAFSEGEFAKCAETLSTFWSSFIFRNSSQMTLCLNTRQKPLACL